MPTITWLGEGEGGAKENTFGGLTLKVGEAVECEDKGTLARAAKNRYFKVEGYEGEVEPPIDLEREVSMPPPSQQTAQYPVPKHGDVTTLKTSVPNPPDTINPPDPPPPEGGARTQGFSPIPPAKK